jgi:hypothetical protein
MKPQIIQLRCWLMLFSLAASLQITLGYYDPAAQRWINRDPIGERGGIPLHVFVGNNPVKRHDPFGWMPPPHDWPIIAPARTCAEKGGELKTYADLFHGGNTASCITSEAVTYGGFVCGTIGGIFTCGIHGGYPGALAAATAWATVLCGQVFCVICDKIS